MPHDSPSAARRAICLLALLAVAPALGADPQPAPGPAKVEPEPTTALIGLVTDSEGNAVPGATVRVLADGLSMWHRERHVTDWVDPSIVAADDQGRFEVTGITAELLTIRAEAPGRGPRSLIELSPNDAALLQLERERRVEGTVLEARSGDPLPGARVIICDRGAFAFGRDACSRVESDDEGRFDAGSLSRSGLILGAVAEGRAFSGLRQIPAGDEDAIDVEVRLEPGASIAGKVVDQRERPVEGVRVRGLAIDGSSPGPAPTADAWPVFTDAEGRFLLDGLRAGRTFRIWTNRADRPRASAGPFEVQAGANRDSLLIVMPEGAAIAWRLVDPDDEPLDEFELYLHRSEDRSEIGFLSRPVADEMIEELAPGAFRSSRHHAGHYELLIVPSGFSEIRRTQVLLNSGEVTDLGTLSAEKGRTLSGRIADPDGLPVAGATVQAWDGGPVSTASRHTSSDDEGRYSIDGLRDAVVTLYVEADGYFGSKHDVDATESVFDVTLDPAAGITGTVLLESEDDSVPEQFSIRVYDEADTVSTSGAVGLAKQQGFATPDGSFRVGELTPGTYTVEARSWGWGGKRRGGIAVVAKETTEIGTLRLAPGKTLRGRVVAASDATPVPGATVELHDRPGWQLKVEHGLIGAAVSDDSGIFEVAGVVAGEYVVRGRHFAYADVEIELHVEADRQLEEIILQLPRGGALTGTVRDGTGQPAPHRTVVLAKSLSDPDTRQASSDPNGAYRIDRIPAGSYEARLLPTSGQGLRITTAVAVIHEGEVTVLDFDDETGIRLHGMVMRSGEPLPRALLFFNPLESALNLAEMRGATTDDEGRYRIELAGPGTYRVMIQTGASGGSSTEISVPDQPDVARDIVLELDGIAGRVVDGEKQPIGGASVSARIDGASAQSLDSLLVSETDAAGRYSIQGLDPGTYRVTAVAAGYRTGVAYPVETAGATVDGIDFELSRGTPLRGIVVDAQGNGIVGAYVLASPAGVGDPLNAASAETDINGAFRMTAPADGPLDVTALPPDRAPIHRTGVTPPEPDDPTGLVLRAGPGGSLRIRIVDASGSPVVGLYVSVSPVPAYVGSAVGRLLRPLPPTDGSGQLLVEHLAPGNYAVSVDGHAELPVASVAVGESAETPLILRIP